jgi:hypothetical protein
VSWMDLEKRLGDICGATGRGEVRGRADRDRNCVGEGSNTFVEGEGKSVRARWRGRGLWGRGASSRGLGGASVSIIYEESGRRASERG